MWEGHRANRWWRLAEEMSHWGWALCLWSLSPLLFKVWFLSSATAAWPGSLQLPFPCYSDPVFPATAAVSSLELDARTKSLSTKTIFSGYFIAAARKYVRQYGSFPWRKRVFTTRALNQCPPCACSPSFLPSFLRFSFISFSSLWLDFFCLCVSRHIKNRCV